jgi:hypothetical protein
MTPPTDTDGLTAAERALKAIHECFANAERDQVSPGQRKDSQAILALLASLRAERLARVRAVREVRKMRAALEPPYSPDTPWNRAWIEKLDKTLTDIAEILGEGKKK